MSELFQRKMVCDFGEFELSHPFIDNAPELRAWDNSDLLLLRSLKEQNQQTPLTVFNDRFGALSRPLAANQLLSNTVTNSELFRQMNEGKLDQINHYGEEYEISKEVIIKVGKSLKEVEYQLHNLFRFCPDVERVFLPVMIKYLSPGLKGLVESFFEISDVSRAWKKARVITCQNPKKVVKKTDEDFWKTRSSESELQLNFHPLCYGYESIDPGARLVLEKMERLPACERVLDFASGNGVLGLHYQKLHPEAVIDYSDENLFSEKLINRSYSDNQMEMRGRFLADNCMEKNLDAEYDLILLNPPFHAELAMGDFIAKEMFHAARELLSTEGELYVVYNRHLPYFPTLKSIFSKVESAGSNKKFNLVRASFK